MGRTQSLHARETTSHPCPSDCSWQVHPVLAAWMVSPPRTLLLWEFLFHFPKKNHSGWVLSLEPMGFILCHLLGMIPEVTDHNPSTSGFVMHILQDASQSLCSSLLPPPPLLLKTPKLFSFKSLLHPYCCGQRLKLSSSSFTVLSSHSVPFSPSGLSCF